MKTDRFLSLNILLLLSVILLFSCKKEEVTEPDDNYDLPLPVVYWERGSEINVYQDIIVDDFILFIDKGVNVRFMNGAKIVVGKMSNGAIIAVGTEDEPINFIPMPDTVQPDEYWNGIFINNNHPGIISTFEHCNFIKGCSEESDAVLNVRQGYVSIKNCLFDYSKKYGVYLQSYVELVEFENNIIKHSLDHPMVMSASNVHKIGENNIFITDFKNKGICLSYFYKESNSNEMLLDFTDSDTIVWNAQTVPYILRSDITFNNGLYKLSEGVVIAIEKPNNDYWVDISISDECENFIVSGSQDNPVIFTSNKENPDAGDWGKIRISGNASFKNCVFEYGGHNMYKQKNSMISIDNYSKVSFDQCIFRYSETDAILFLGEPGDFHSARFTYFSNNTFSNIGGFAISLYPEIIPSLGPDNNFNNNLIRLLSLKFPYNTQWKNPGGAFYVNGEININDYVTIEFEPGVVVKFASGGFHVGKDFPNTLICKGTESNPIIFTSAKDNPGKGDWSGIYFDKKSTSECILDNCQVLYAGKMGIYSPASIWVISGVTVRNCTIAHSIHYGLTYYNYVNPVIENNTFFDNEDGDLLGVGLK